MNSIRALIAAIVDLLVSLAVGYGGGQGSDAGQGDGVRHVGTGTREAPPRNLARF